MDKVRVLRKSFLGALLVIAPFVSAELVIKESSPQQYKVKKGDTLWDISAVFLKSPWKWPQLWETNSQIKNPHLIYPNDIIYLSYRDGKPYLSKGNSGSIAKLSPRVRHVDRFSPITAIPQSIVKEFVENYRIVDKSRINQMPYIVSGVGLRELMGVGDEVYIKGALDPDFSVYHIYRKNRDYAQLLAKGANTSEIRRIGSLEVSTTNENLSTAKVIASNGLVKKGDFLVRSQAFDSPELFYLAAAPKELNGRIVAAVNNKFQVAKNDGVVINFGVDSGLFPGHVFKVIKAPFSIKDPRSNENILVDNQVIAELMVVNVFDNLSYGVILNAKEIVSVGDKLAGIN